MQPTDANSRAEFIKVQFEALIEKATARQAELEAAATTLGKEVTERQEQIKKIQEEFNALTNQRNLAKQSLDTINYIQINPEPAPAPKVDEAIPEPFIPESGNGQGDLKVVKRK